MRYLRYHQDHQGTKIDKNTKDFKKETHGCLCFLFEKEKYVTQI